MSDKSGGIPWAGLAVMVAFVASATLQPAAFDQLRPPEKERAQAPSTSALEVEARLWEDPFSAARRHEAERLERCDKLYRDPAQQAQCRGTPRSRTVGALQDLMGFQSQRQASTQAAASDVVDAQKARARPEDFLIMTVLVPGNAFVGAEESRRRTRYALLAGLQSQGYLPDNAERLGLLSLDVRIPPNTYGLPDSALDKQDGAARLNGSGNLLVPFELLSRSRLPRAAISASAADGASAAGASAASATNQQPAPAAEAHAGRAGNGGADTQEMFRQVVVLWVDEAALPEPKLHGLAMVMKSLFDHSDDPEEVPGRRQPTLAVIGPSSTDGLRTALLDLHDYNRDAIQTRWKKARLKAVLDALDRAAVDRVAGPALASAAWEEAQRDASAGSEAARCSRWLDGAPGPGVAAASSSPFQGLAASDAEEGGPVAQGYWILSHADFYNPFSTASFDMLNLGAPAGVGSARPPASGAASTARVSDPLDRYLNGQFCLMFGRPPDRPLHMQRTITTDDRLLTLLVDELGQRLQGRKKRIVILAERDSLYAQALESGLKQELQKEPSGRLRGMRIDTAYFFRGLDGVNHRDAAREGLADDGGKPGKPGAPAPIEWPESRAQLDYLRGLAASLRDSEDGGPAHAIGAIGILASDVHDKLLILQALRDSFPDRVFFTTDMDSRLTHPRTQAFTRNLLVASSLPLRFPDEERCRTADGTEYSLQGRSLGGGNPPWRDVYQSSTYLAARMASCRSEACKAAERCATQEALDRPSLYEIGREDAVVLGGYARDKHLGRSSQGWWLAWLGLITVIALGLLVWPGSPSIRAGVGTLAWRRHRSSAGRPAIGRGQANVLILYTFAGGFLLGSLAEVQWPGLLRLDPSNAHSATFITTPVIILALGAVSAALLWAALRPHIEASHGLHRDHPSQPLDPVQHGRHPPSASLYTLAVPLMWLAVLLVQGLRWSGDCADCEPAFWTQGVSAWPSQLLHLLALFCIVWTLEATWYRAQVSLTADARELHLPRPPDLSRRLSMGAIGAIWHRSFGVLTWPHPVRGPCEGVNARQVWREYVRRTGRKPRLLRMGVASLFTAALMVLVYFAVPGAIPSLPARGIDDRQLFFVTLELALAGLPLVVVAVGDVTLLTSRFIALLSDERSFYPQATLRTFAAELGFKHADLSVSPIACAPAARVPPVPGGKQAPGLRHSLLDDWIDMQIVARRTEEVAPLVIAPFVVLALLVVARSRLFDAWSVTLPICLLATVYLFGAVLLALQLKWCAERARRQALVRMEEDLRWMQGCRPDLDPLIDPFKGLIQAVKDDRRGAFAPFVEQPLVRALLLPLGGAGGAQLLDYLLLAK